MAEYSPSTVSQLTCLSMLIILVAIIIFYLYIYRKNVKYFLKHGRFAPAHQGRACPGCGSDDLSILKGGSARCNACGALFASTKQLVSKKGK